MTLSHQQQQHDTDRSGHRQMNKGTDEEMIPNCQPAYAGDTQDVQTVVVTARAEYL